jgi:hypothetical protein
MDGSGAVVGAEFAVDVLQMLAHSALTDRKIKLNVGSPVCPMW